jgi:hypothetical protein
MDKQHQQLLLRIVTDDGEHPADRGRAARFLDEADDQAVLDELVHLAQVPTLDKGLSRAVGESIAILCRRMNRLDQVPLHDFNEDAFIAYDEAVARHLRSQADASAWLRERQKRKAG